MQSLFETLSPFLQALSAAGGLAIPLLTGKILREHWAVLDNFETKSWLARTASVLLFYMAVLYPAFAGWLTLKMLIAKFALHPIWGHAADMGALLYTFVVAALLWRKQQAETPQPLPPKKGVGGYETHPRKESAQVLPPSPQALASAVLEWERTLSKVVDLEASEKGISPFLQGLLATSQDNLGLMLRRCPPQQLSAKSQDNDPTP